MTSRFGIVMLSQPIRETRPLPAAAAA